MDDSKPTPGATKERSEAAFPSLSGQTIAVHVGKAEKSVTFQVHENILCRSSPFFRKAITGNWKEKLERAITLSEDDPEVFELYMQWLYFQHVPSAQSLATPTRDRGSFHLTIEAYLFGEKILDTTFKNVLVDRFIGILCLLREDGQWTFPGETYVNSIYGATTKNSPFRKLIADVYIVGVSADLIKDMGGSEGENLSRAFLFDLVWREKAIWSGMPAEDRYIRWWHRCFYHEHDEGHTACGGEAPDEFDMFPPTATQSSKSSEGDGVLGTLPRTAEKTV